MRRPTFGGANSLDNYLARADHAIDWLKWSKEAAEVTAGYRNTVDTVLMGRKTYEVALRQTRAGGYPGVTSYVFSRTLMGLPEGGATLVSDDAAGFVRELKQMDGKDICLMGGGELARLLFDAGLIDEIGFNIHPVLLGSGIPLFHPMDRQMAGHFPGSQGASCPKRRDPALRVPDDPADRDSWASGRADPLNPAHGRVGEI